MIDGQVADYYRAVRNARAEDAEYGNRLAKIKSSGSVE